MFHEHEDGNGIVRALKSKNARTDDILFRTRGTRGFDEVCGREKKNSKQKQNANN